MDVRKFFRAFKAARPSERVPLFYVTEKRRANEKYYPLCAELCVIKRNWNFESLAECEDYVRRMLDKLTVTVEAKR
jgi:hypothetical protein